MTDAQTGNTDNSLGDVSTGSSSSGQTGSHSQLFGLQGQKRASTTAGAGAGSGIIGTSGHAGSVNKGANQDVGEASQNTGLGGIAEGGKSSAISGSGGESFSPSQGTGDVRPAGEATGEKKLLDKLNPLK